jgi:hypothetical protein
MKKVLQRRPSASLIISIMALVLAASGTAVAASKLVNGDKLIKKHSLSGNRLKNHTITAKQINKSKLGKVPSAKNADFATTAGSATSATNASNAADLGGQPASAYMPANRLIQGGVVKLAAPSTSGLSTSQTLLTAGPFTVTGKCTNAGGSGTTAEVDASSSQANSDIGGTNVATAGTSQMLDSVTDTVFDERQTMWDYDSTLLAPGGQGYTLIGDEIANPTGAAGTCEFDLEALLLS